MHDENDEVNWKLVHAEYIDEIKEGATENNKLDDY